jgi:hypothetical protein
MWIRQIHRWLSVVFTLVVIGNPIIMMFGKPPAWMIYAPLPPLFLMLITGLYLFAQPCLAKRRVRPLLEHA